MLDARASMPERAGCEVVHGRFVDELSPCLRKEINLDLNTEVIYRCNLFKNLLDRDSDNLGEIMTEDTSDHVLVAIINALEREVCFVCLNVCTFAE